MLNGSVAVYTAFFASDRVWSIYNGGISYVLMGILFSVEYLIRKREDKKMMKTYPFVMVERRNQRKNISIGTKKKL